MTDKEKLDATRAEIHRLVDVRGYDKEMANDLFAFMDSLPNEPASEDLEEAARKYFKSLKDDCFISSDIMLAFKAGANWQKQQLMAKAFDFTKEHNTSCVLASECLRNHGWFNRERDFNDLFRHLSCVDELFEGKFCGKTKVIVIKED